MHNLSFSYKDTRHWIRAHPRWIWPHLSFIISARTLFPNKVIFTVPHYIRTSTYILEVPIKPIPPSDSLLTQTTYHSPTDFPSMLSLNSSLNIHCVSLLWVMLSTQGLEHALFLLPGTIFPKVPVLYLPSSFILFNPLLSETLLDYPI